MQTLDDTLPLRQVDTQFQFSIRDAAKKFLHASKMLDWLKFQFSIRDADLAAGTKVLRAWITFQFSIRDAPPPEEEDDDSTRCCFNSLFEMPPTGTTSPSGPWQPLKSFNSLFEMQRPLSRYGQGQEGYCFNSLFEMPSSRQGGAWRGRVCKFQFSIRDAARVREGGKLAMAVVVSILYSRCLPYSLLIKRATLYNGFNSLFEMQTKKTSPIPLSSWHVSILYSRC